MFKLRKIFVVVFVAGLSLTACGGQKATEVNITLTDSGIESSITDFQTGALSFRGDQ